MGCVPEQSAMNFNQTPFCFVWFAPFYPVGFLFPHRFTPLFHLSLCFYPLLSLFDRDIKLILHRLWFSSFILDKIAWSQIGGGFQLNRLLLTTLSWSLFCYINQVKSKLFVERLLVQRARKSIRSFLEVGKLFTHLKINHENYRNWSYCDSEQKMWLT